MTVTDADKLTIVKLLAGGRDPEFVAAAVNHDVDTVVRTASAHGYPDRGKLAWAADLLQKQSDEAGRNAVPGARRSLSPSARPVAAPPVRDEVRALIARGLKSETPRVRRLAQKAADAVDALGTALAQDEAARRAAAAQAAEKARARQEGSAWSASSRPPRRSCAVTAPPRAEP
jgi:hypothetical protein